MPTKSDTASIDLPATVGTMQDDINAIKSRLDGLEALTKSIGSDIVSMSSRLDDMAKAATLPGTFSGDGDRRISRLEDVAAKYFGHDLIVYDQSHPATTDGSSGKPS